MDKTNENKILQFPDRHPYWTIEITLTSRPKFGIKEIIGLGLIELIAKFMNMQMEMQGSTKRKCD